MGMSGTEQTHHHSLTDLCAEGKQLYAAALRAGRIAKREIETAPCLVDFALLHPDPDDPDWLRPVAPSIALAQRLHPIEREIQEQRRQSVDLTTSFDEFMAISAQAPPSIHAITVLEGSHRINAALDVATTELKKEVLTVQPGGGRPEHLLSQAITRSKPLIDRGISMRTLYQHTVRYSQNTFAYIDHLAGAKMEIRTMEQLIERLIICDDVVAFIPARDDDGAALELRHPGLVSYLTKIFDHLWQRATPLVQPLSAAPDAEGITEVQRSIAKLLVEGLVDEAIARRLGMNVRTCRAHIAKLAAALGSGSRAQLGFLIAQSGILGERD
ncbi:helix-turn-helix transcriptional regulator [Streptomyces montanisoli]|uniref:Helix-turn-helix transcriptional regulator n=1 Tax=Streptomyces montanisoli TaxID=2798581 RepID=A0A940MAB7_9ACTN|nr:helix-turn-helix transcriptional regulator [Streptomyces montanisoli]MBP0456012.1 helix-turn-helix transcriptional regulator [Streptomyces montanisoli]